MRYGFLAVVLLLAVVSSAVIAAPIQWEASAGGNGHWYEYVPTAGLNWDQAREAAAASVWQAQQGYLATITSAQENTWIAASILPQVTQPPSVRLWLGGYQDRTAPDYSEPGGGWRWITGESWAYTNWGSYRVYVGSGQYEVRSEPSNDSLPSDPLNNEEEDWLQVVLGFYTNSPVAWNDTTYCAGFNGTPGGNGYLVEYGAVPEPSSTACLLCGGIGCVVWRRRNR